MYFAVIDILRFLSSVAVFFHHTFLSYFYYGKLGVYLFFIISGFVIYFSLHKGIKNYVTGRFLRLYPIFWICATITFAVTWLYQVNTISLQHFIVGLLMFNSGRMETMIDGSYWTLTFELLFYFYIGVFVLLFGTKKLEWFYISWLLISFFTFFFKIDQVFFVKLLSVRFAPYFVFGGMLALFIDRYKTSTLRMKLVSIVTMVSSAALPPYISERLQAQKETITNFTGSFDWHGLLIVESFFIIMPIAVYLSYLPFAKKEQFTKIAFLLGGITYPLYLLHWKIGDTIITYYSGHDMYGKVTLLSILVAVLIFTVAYVLSLYDLRLRNFLKEKYFNQK